MTSKPRRWVPLLDRPADVAQRAAGSGRASTAALASPVAGRPAAGHGVDSLGRPNGALAPVSAQSAVEPGRHVDVD